MPPFSYVLAGGDVIDGSGAPRRRADVAIADGRIAAIDRIEGATAEHVIDARGLVVAPGFIDVHNHSDGWLLKLRHQVSKTSQGFTTEVIMSDGISYAPVSPESAADWLFYLRSLNGLEPTDYRGWHSLAEYVGLLDRQTAQNVAWQIPFANVRVLAKGWDRHPPDDGQLRHMRHVVAEAMAEGAVGLSTGLDYISQCFATTDELAETCSAMAPFGGVYATHVRYKKGLLAGVREAVAIGRAAGVPVHISHLKAESRAAADELFDYLDGEASRQVDITFDVYPYLPGATMLNFFLPYEVWTDGPLAALGRLTRVDVRRHLAAFLSGPGGPRLENVILAWVGSRANQRWQGRPLADYVAFTGRSAADAICDLLIAENLAVAMVVHVGQEALVEPFLQHPKFMLGSDGIFFPDGLVHPRQYGSAARLLGPLVRDRQLFTLEAAVRKLSGLAAQRFGLHDRGELRVGAAADVVAFDPATITDRATFADPHQTCVGVHHVLVNGRAVVADGVPVETFAGPWPGRVIGPR